MFKGCLLVVGLMVLLGVLGSMFMGHPQRGTENANAAKDAVIEAGALTMTAHQFLREHLRDPDSAQFDYDLPRSSGLFCGIARGKNGFGGYANPLHYILFPFVFVTSENESPTRFKRLWTRFCVDEPGVVPLEIRPANRVNSMLLAADATDRAWMLGLMIDENCNGKDAYFMGAGTAGISKDVAFWSIRCARMGKSFEVEVPPNGAGHVLECAVLQSLRAGQCYRKLRPS